KHLAHFTQKLARFFRVEVAYVRPQEQCNSAFTLALGYTSGGQGAKRCEIISRISGDPEARVDVQKLEAAALKARIRYIYRQVVKLRLVAERRLDQVARLFGASAAKLDDADRTFYRLYYFVCVVTQYFALCSCQIILRQMADSFEQLGAKIVIKI